MQPSEMSYGSVDNHTPDAEAEPLLKQRKWHRAASLVGTVLVCAFIGACVTSVLERGDVSSNMSAIQTASDSSHLESLSTNASPPQVDSQSLSKSNAAAVAASAQVHSARAAASIRVIRSQRDSSDRLTPKQDIAFQEDFPDNVVVTIDSQVEFQEILGFGGAITEAATHTLAQLDDKLVQQVIDAYYSQHGLRYTLARVPMNSCDFSLDSYNFDDTPDDFLLKFFDFTLAHEQKTQIPFMRRAIKASNDSIRFFTSPWSPPAWMKGNGAMTGSSTPGLKEDVRYHQAWALYIARFLQAYREQGVPFWGMTVQNEPEFAAPWEACVYSPEQQRDFIKNHLGPTLAKEKLSTRVMIYDHNKDHIVKWASTIFSDPDAAQYVWGTAFHWYSGDQFDQIFRVHQSFPEKHLLASEACHCPNVHLDEWTRGEGYAHDIIGDLNNFAEGWVDWNIVLNHEGGPNHLGNLCDAAIIASAANQTLHYQPMYYAMGHFSKFIPPGSKRVLVKVVGNPQMEFTAFKTPANKLVSVVINRSDYNTTFKLKLADDPAHAALIPLHPHSFQTLII